MAPKAVQSATVEGDPQAYENLHVHAVYNQIADHFSSTRYKPWPIIKQFMDSLDVGSIGLDSGTGNGKYLPLPTDRPGSVWTIGLDRSRNLLLSAQQAGGVWREVVWGDVLGSGWRSGAFDFAISIATIHHLASEERRIQAVERLLQAVSAKHGRVLIYVWAIEQDQLSKRTIPGNALGDPVDRQGKDVFVPWQMTAAEKDAQPQTFNRFYHMYSQGELAQSTREAAQRLGLHIGKRGAEPQAEKGVEIVQDGWERSNYYVELRRWTNEN